MTAEQKKRNRRIQQARRRRQAILLGLCIGSILLMMICLTQCRPAADKDPDLTGGADENSALRAEDTIEKPQTSTTPLIDSLPDGWSTRQASDTDLSGGTLVLVNRSHAFDPELPETVSVYDNKASSYLVKDVYLGVTADTMVALNRWMNAFAEETGRTDINIVAGYRSREDQAYLYQNAVNTKGQAHADAYLALPGHSEHHTGLAVDLDTYDVAAGTSGGFDGTGAYAWAVEHAWEYGFVQRYPPQKSDITGISYEAWHFRYVGLPHAYVMASENLCLEEYIDYLRTFPFSGEHLYVTCLDRSYEIYFCPKNQLVVPTNGSCTISGNNVDGFVVTIDTEFH